MTAGRHFGEDVAVRHLAAIVAASDDAIISKDRDAVIRSWNPGAERLYGWMADEVIGRPISILVPAYRAGEERRVLDRILAGERLDHYETERIRRDGRSVWVSLTISPVRDDSGEIVAAAVISRDITERREAQQERERLLAEARSARAIAERSRARLSLLNAASEVLTASFDVQPGLGRLAGLLAASFAEQCSIHLCDGGDLHLVVAVPSASEDEDLAALRDEAIATERVVMHADVAAAPPPLPGDPVVTPRAAIAAVIPSRHGALGVITTVAQRDALYDDEDLSLVRDIARRAGLAIESSRAYAVEHTVALTLQRSLLPHDLPEIGGLQVAARYVPAAPNLNVGGDWYDVMSAPDGSVVAAIGDVAGHGLAAAAAMGQLRNIVRAYAFDGRASASLLGRLNRFVDATGGLGMATLALVRFPPQGGRIEIVRAGHPSPFVRRADGSVEWLNGPAGLPIGAGPTAAYVETVHPLGPGDTVVLFTDGLVERRGESIDAGIARLGDALASAPVELEAMCDAVMDGLTPPQAERMDDTALIALRTVAVDAHSFVFREPGRPTMLAMLRRRLRAWLEDGRPDPRTVHAIVTACNEAASNVVEHAYRETDGPLEVTGRRYADGGVSLVVRDEGSWRPERETGGGRGRGIIEALCDEVDVQTGAGGTAVTMRHLGGQRD